MQLKQWLSQFKLAKLSFKLPFLEAEWNPVDADRDAAWDLYVEMLTRVVTQRIPAGSGDEKTALDSIYSLFPTTRTILKQHGRKADRFARLAIVVLNQMVRPFTARWHRLSLAGAFADPVHCATFRAELVALQDDLQHFMRALADLAGVEDMTAWQPDT